jgi:MoaA/NifB/PqqE/SkfB family radical SAM enzyme
MKRIDVFLGKECNNNCIFCCSKNEKGNLTTKEVVDILNKSYKDGAREVHFSGSEPTIRKDFFEIVRHAKKIGFENIKITTNGRMLAYPKFCKMMAGAGVNSIIFSVHGHNAELHDYLTRTKGSFEQLMKGVKNAKDNRLKIESNTAIVKQNYKHLKEIADMLVRFGFSSSELIFVHPKGNAYKEYDRIVPRLVEIEKSLQKAIEVGIKDNKLILSRYVPFCFLGKYVNYCSEIYEPMEVEQAGENFYDLDARKTRKEVTMKKSLVCKECRYDLICMGIHKEHTGDELDFKPVAGIKIRSREELANG